MKKTGILIVGAILIACGLVAAGTIICLSNVVEHENSVEVAVDLSLLTTTATPGGDLPDYADGSLLMGQQYDMMIQYTTSKALSSSAIIIEFGKSAIIESDLSMYWTDGTTWTQMIWLDSGDVLTGTSGLCRFSAFRRDGDLLRKVDIQRHQGHTGSKSGSRVRSNDSSGDQADDRRRC